jgi:UDP-N-acetylmuramoyl-tripeptide--D-alanyl-D-alanine ligase
LPEILAATGGDLVRWGAGRYRGFSTDTRRLRSGDAFVALRGPNFDGHEFVPQAIAAGARAVVVEHDRPVAADVACIRVGDGLRALGDLAAAWRRRHAVRIVGVTGSNGKTTTKEMIAAVLAACGAKVAKSAGNENNLVGVPQTLFRLDGDEDFAVVEMGMNHPGEIWRLAEIARPDVGVITNVGPAHLEGLGSIENVAAAKGEMALALGSGATLVVNGADPRLVAIAERFSGRKLFVGTGRVRAVASAPSAAGQRVEIAIDEETFTVELAIRGAHNVVNALVAAAVGLVCDLDGSAIVDGLARFRPPPMRLERVTLASGVCVLNDAYNANPASMEAALAALASEPAGRRFAVLGEMLELGPESARYHRAVGAAAARAAVDGLIAVGEHAADTAAGALGLGLAADRVETYATAADAAARLARILASGDVVLVKGSRGARMEEVVERLRSHG